jgi:hypothetical protein
MIPSFWCTITLPGISCADCAIFSCCLQVFIRNMNSFSLNIEDCSLLGFQRKMNDLRNHRLSIVLVHFILRGGRLLHI